MQPMSNPDFMHGDFEMFSGVWRSIESLFLTAGLRKNYAREVGIRSVPQYQISPNFLFWGLFRGGRTRKIDHYAKIRYGRGKDIPIYHQIVLIYIIRDQAGRRHPINGSDIVLPGRSVLHAGIESGDLVGVV